MDNKLLLIDLVERFRTTLHSGQEYIVCNQLLTKIASSMLTYDYDNNKLELEPIYSITEEEKKMFTSPECEKIISALMILPKKKGWRIESVFKLVKKLQEDVLENKFKEFEEKESKLDELFRIIDEELYNENYLLLLDFIKMTVESKMISITDAINLNFYILKQANDYNLVVEDDVEVIELHENIDSVIDIREKLQNIFNKYGYVYDENKMGDLDDKFIKYAKLDYVDYILSRFKEYGISSNELYIRKRALCNIVIDNDKETFNSILNFINNNDCTLLSLLGIPAIFSKRKRSYVERNKGTSGGGGSSFDVVGANKDFLENIALYKKLAGVSVVKDNDLYKLGKFLCTPSSLVNKNLLLLEKYGIISKGQLPKAIVSLCGNHTEYIIDRIIELGLYEDYLLSRVTKNGEVKQARGTYFLDGDDNPFKFYKMKRANDLGHSILATNAGIRKEFKDNSKEYMGLSLVRNDDGSYVINQAPLSMDVINSINPEIRKKLPEIVYHKVLEGVSPEVLVDLHFKNLYEYKTFSPIEIFEKSDKATITNLKGERVAAVFKRDYKNVISNEELHGVLGDDFIKLLDNAIYCNVYGISNSLKKSELAYEFSHPSFPNIKVTISRYKVLRLCKLLKEEGCWINQNSSDIDKENTLLSIIIKDTIISDTEMIMLRNAVRAFLTSGMIKIPVTGSNDKDKRGAR